jgi:hypothetical protein
MWIEVPVKFAIKKEGEPDFESMGIDRPHKELELKDGRCVINLNLVTRFNETTDQKGTIFFFSEMEQDCVRTEVNFDLVRKILQTQNPYRNDNDTPTIY